MDAEADELIGKRNTGSEGIQGEDREEDDIQRTEDESDDAQHLAGRLPSYACAATLGDHQR